MSWKTRYIGSSRDIPGNAVNGGRLKEIFYHDLQATLDLQAQGLNFAVGVDNVFDQMPPAFAANNPTQGYAMNLTGEPEGRWRRMRVATNTVFTNALHPSSVILPVIPRRG